MDNEGEQLSYRTYICDANALFDPELVANLKRETDAFVRVFRGYLSTWRVLHIDGFEPRYRLIPFHMGVGYQFFNYATTKEAGGQRDSGTHEQKSQDLLHQI